MAAKGPQIEIFVGSAPTNRTERQLVARLKRDLAEMATDAVVLANFYVGAKSLQIDVVVATEQSACVVEVKGFLSPVAGGLNGTWKQKLDDGTERSLGQRNPYDQTVEARHAVVDALVKAGGNRETVLAALTGLVCIYPSIPANSSLPCGNYKAWIGEYAKLIELLGGGAPTPIGLDAWRQMASRLNLQREEDVAPVAQANVVDEYRARFLELRAARTEPYHPTPISTVEGELTEDNLVTFLRDGAQFQFNGGSGAGKSVLFERLSALSAGEGMLPIAISAHDFDKDLGHLLRRAVASASTVRVSALMAAAGDVGAPVILFVDGMNECPADKKAKLIEALQAARLHFDAQVLITSQQSVGLPASLQGKVFDVRQPDRRRARLLVETHLGRILLPAEEAGLDIVATANDAAVLAEVIRDPAAVDGRYSLYAAFVRRRIGDYPETPAALRVLRVLADHMRHRFVTVLPRDVSLRIMAGSVPSKVDESVVEQLALRSGLLIDHEGLIKFRHDLIADFLAADHLLMIHADAAELAAELKRPIHAELAEFAVGGCASARDLDVILRSAGTNQLREACLRGSCGSKAKAWVIGRCQSLLDKLEVKFTQTSFALPPADGQARYTEVEGRFVGSSPYEEDDLAFLELLPATIGEGLLPSVLSMFRQIDTHMVAEADRLHDRHPGIRWRWKPRVLEAVYGFPSLGPDGEFHKLFQAAKLHRFGRDKLDNGAYKAVVDVLETRTDLTAGEMFFLVQALIGLVDREDLPPANLADVMQRAWDERVHHLSLDAVDMAQRFARRLPDDQRIAIGDMLTSWLSNSSPMMNGQIFDVLGMIDCWEPNITKEAAFALFAEALAKPESQQANDEALTLYTLTFDHPDREVYAEAYCELSAEQSQQLHIRAVQVNDRRFSMAIPWIVAELAKNPAPAAIPAFEKYAVAPNEDTFSIQDSLTSFANAVGALARLNAALPTFPEPSPEVAAWLKIAPLIYAINHEDGPGPAAARHWLELEGLGASRALDPVWRLVAEARRGWGISVEMDLLPHFADGVLRLCRAALEKDYVAQSLFQRFHNPRDLIQSHRRFALGLLGQFGRQSDLRLIQQWLDDREIGLDALRAARQIEGRPVHAVEAGNS